MMSLLACVFDMDGIMLDSEPLWRQAEVATFASVGIPLTEAQCMETMGMRVDEVVAFRHASQPWSSRSQGQVVAEILDRVERLIREEAAPLPGLLEALAFFQRRSIPVALASSSPMRLIQAVLETLGLADRFQVIYSAENEKFGKPHPAVYLSTCQRLQLPPARCLAVEDSVNGMRSALEAGMPVIVIPEEAVRADARFAPATLQLRSLLELPEAWGQLVADAG